MNLTEWSKGRKLLYKIHDLEEELKATQSFSMCPVVETYRAALEERIKKLKNEFEEL